MVRSISDEEILAKFTEWTASPGESLIRWKEKNKKKVIGCFPMDIPEEIIHAAGMLPVVMWENDEPITQGHAHISPYNCGIIRSVIDDSARGKLDFLDGIVSYETCLQARHLPFILRKTGQQAYCQRIFLPGMVTSAAGRLFMIDNLKRLKESLEHFGNLEISPEGLNQSILIYNENRGLLRRLYQLRKRNPGLLKAKEILAIVHSSMLMLKEEHNQLLRPLLQDLEKRALIPEKRARVILSGSLCEAPQSVILDLIEEAGMVIVDDDLYVGSRYFANDALADGDPLAGPHRPLHGRGTPFPHEGRFRDGLGRLHRPDGDPESGGGSNQPGGEILSAPLAYYPDIERKLSGAGIHALMLEMEHEVTSLEQVKTRLQAFGESLEMI